MRGLSRAAGSSSRVEELLPDQDGALQGDGDWALQRQGRYAHDIDYVVKVARHPGFTIRTLERQTLRYEADAAGRRYLCGAGARAA